MHHGGIEIKGREAANAVAQTLHSLRHLHDAKAGVVAELVAAD